MATFAGVAALRQAFAATWMGTLRLVVLGACIVQPALGDCPAGYHVEWTLGGGDVGSGHSDGMNSGSCDAVCAELGKVCEQSELDALLGVDDSVVLDRYQQAGYECTPGLSIHCERHDPADSLCEAWGAPYIHNSHVDEGGCWAGDPPAPCSRVPIDGHHRRLCPCVTCLGDDSCTFAHDGMCDELTMCDAGTDCSDCGECYSMDCTGDCEAAAAAVLVLFLIICLVSCIALGSGIYCCIQSKSKQGSRPTAMAWLASLVICIFIGPLCMWIPFVIDSCYEPTRQQTTVIVPAPTKDSLEHRSVLCWDSVQNHFAC